MNSFTWEGFNRSKRNLRRGTALLGSVGQHGIIKLRIKERKKNVQQHFRLAGTPVILHLLCMTCRINLIVFYHASVEMHCIKLFWCILSFLSGISDDWRIKVFDFYCKMMLYPDVNWSLLQNLQLWWTCNWSITLLSSPEFDILSHSAWRQFTSGGPLIPSNDWHTTRGIRMSVLIQTKVMDGRFWFEVWTRHI